MKTGNIWLRTLALTLLEKGSGLVFSFGTAVLLLRGLSKEDFAAWGLFVLLGYFVEMGRSGLLQNGMIRYLGLHKQDAAGSARIGTAALVLNLAFSLLSIVVFVVLAPYMAQLYKIPQILPLISLYALSNIALWWMSHCNYTQQAYFEFRGIFWSTFIARGALFAWVVLSVFIGRALDLYSLALAMTVGSYGGAAASWLFAARYLHRLTPPDFSWIRRLLAFGKYVLGTNLSAMFYKSVDKLALGQYAGPGAFAIYDAAAKITQLVETPSFSVAAAVFPHGATRLEESGKEGIKRLYERSVGAILAVILPFLILVLAFAEPIMLLFAGPQYAESADVLRLTAFFGLFMPFAVQFGTILDATGKPALNFLYTLFTAVLNLALSLYLVRQFGLFGAAYATLTGYFISFLLMQRLLYRRFGIRWYRAFYEVPGFYLLGKNLIVNRLARLRT